jgi:hypothetical protein
LDKRGQEACPTLKYASVRGMTRTLVAAAIVVLLSAATADAQSKRKPDPAYRQFVAKVTGGDLSIDFRALRMACLNSADCDPTGDRNQLTAMRNAAGAGDHKAAVKAAEKLIATGFPNIEAHAACASAWAALGDSEKAAFHKAVTSGLLRSIVAGKDGLSPETAFEVIDRKSVV